MPIPNTQHELSTLFSELGANDPESWASSQINEGIPQLLRFLFLRNAWQRIPAEGNTAWIDDAISASSNAPTAPYAGLGQVLEECRSKGVSDQSLTELARCLQAQMLFEVCHLIDDPWPVPKQLAEVSWGLFQTDSEGKPFGPAVSGLHESVLELDPSGREVRPL